MKVGLFICSYNRPEYLKKCLDSVRTIIVPEGVELILSIVDDHSDDPKTHDLLGIDCYDYIIHNKNNQLGIKNSIERGSEYFLQQRVDLIINLDSDAIVTPDFLEKILEAKAKYPALMVTGFNCNTLNRDSTIRHQIMFREPGLNFKKTVGGINLAYSVDNYLKWIRPALKETGNWDQRACLNAAEDSCPIAVIEPSVVQHIGIHSALGHGMNGEPPDTADDFNFPAPAKKGKKELPTVTLVGVDCLDIDRLIKVAEHATEHFEFGEVLLFSSIPSNNPWVTEIRHIGSKEDYSFFMVKELFRYLGTDHLLVIQHDGMIKNPDAWDDSWLQYDYIGAPWYFGDAAHPVGNGGFSLRTRKLHEIIAIDKTIKLINEPGVNFHKEEDHCICRVYGKYLIETYGFKFAPIEVANKFSIEAWKNPDPVYRGQFGIHGQGIKF